MRLLFVADGRSPIALNWISYFVQVGHEVHLASSFPCKPELNLASCSVLPLPLSPGGEIAGNASGIRRFIPVRLRSALRQRLVPLALPRTAKVLRQRVADIQPDLVHAMRIPYEGMLAALAELETPLLVSVWGNDFTYHAKATPLMSHYTRMTLGRANALHTDCQRDRHLAHSWGYAKDRPCAVMPGNGGVQLEYFHPQPADMPQLPLVINPRGLRAYVRNDTFFQSVPLVMQRVPEVQFICPAMHGESEALRWVERLGIHKAVTLLPRQTRPQMAELFRQARVAVSITEHDGTPNTLLEAMACGCFPIAGDIETSHEWIKPGVNGYLVQPDDVVGLAEAISCALENSEMRIKAAAINQQLVKERAEYQQVMSQAEKLYQELREKSVQSVS